MSALEPSIQHARILYWGIPGAGVSTNLHGIHAKLRADRRGELQIVTTPIDPSVSYEMLPIELGQIQGMKTQIHVVGLPGQPEQAPTRMQLLDMVDGIVLVLDSRGECLEANISHAEELREALRAYGREIDEFPLVLQYNKCDLAEPHAIEDLHRKLGITEAEVFETVANQGTGVLQTLTTISKLVVRRLREETSAFEPEPTAVAEPTPPAVAEPLPAVALEPEPTPPEAPTVAVAAPAMAEVTEPGPVFDAEPFDEPFEDADEPFTDEAFEDEAFDGAATVLERGLLADDAGAVETVHETQTSFEQSWSELERAALADEGGVRLDAGLRVLSVGRATKAGERSVRIPVLLGNEGGDSVTVALTISLDPLLDEAPD